jgi:hypothetical protein
MPTCSKCKASERKQCEEINASKYISKYKQIHQQIEAIKCINKHEMPNKQKASKQTSECKQ